MPPAARWSYLQNSAKQPTIGKIVDDAMVAIERDNPRLKGVLPKDYARPALDTARRDSAFLKREAKPQSLSAAKDNHRLGELIGTIGLGDKESRSKDILGRVYEPSEARQTARSAARRVSAANQYFLTQPSGARSTMRSIARRVPWGRYQFASAEGKNGGQWSGATWTTAGSPEGWRGGANQFYTPSCVVRLLVEMLAPYTALRDSAFLQSEASPQVVSEAKDNGRIYDPACGSGGSLPASRLCGERFAEMDRAIAQGVVQSEKFVESHGGKLGDISVYGQDKWARRQRPFGLAKRARRVRLRGQQPKQSNATTRRLAIMNLAIRGIEADFGPEHADTFRRDLHPDLRADYVLATAERDSALSNAKPYRRACRRQDNPMPFNDSDTALRGSAFLQCKAISQVVSKAKDNFRKDDDVRWQFGVPPKGNANFAWVQHFIHHLAPHGMAGFVLANGSMSSNQSGEGFAQLSMEENVYDVGIVETRPVKYHELPTV